LSATFNLHDPMPHAHLLTKTHTRIILTETYTCTCTPQLRLDAGGTGVSRAVDVCQALKRLCNARITQVCGVCVRSCVRAIMRPCMRACMGLSATVSWSGQFTLYII
jgi:hypothetical protein